MYSSGGATELMSRGLAAAQSRDVRDHDEAEFYLEWAIRAGASMEEQMEAWLWLSRIAKSEERRRDCLENVLAIRPSHPDARRDMAILEGRLKSEEIRADPWHGGRAVGGSAQIQAGEAKRFPCPKCGASVLFTPGMDVLACQFCGAKIDESGQIAGDAPVPGSMAGDVSEQDWVAAIYTETGHNWNLPMQRVLQCEGCGATVTFAPALMSAKCPYCASGYTVKAAPPGTSLREPDGIVPFAFDAPAALEHARAWLRMQSGRGNVPLDLAEGATLHDLSPIYLPFWLFEIGGEVRWSGFIRDDLGMGGNLRDADNMMNVGGAALGIFTGNPEFASQGVANIMQSRTERHGLVRSEGAVPVAMSDVAVPATQSVPPKLLQALQYSAGGAQPYREEMLAAIPAEVYTVSMSDASLQARQAAIAQGDKDIELFTGSDTEGDEFQLRKDRRGMTVVSYKLLLLPAWTAGYAYKGKEYKLVVNGQSGGVEGYLPRKEGTIKRLFGRGE